jgi:hypothetical protein
MLSTKALLQSAGVGDANATTTNGQSMKAVLIMFLSDIQSLI